MNRAVLTPDAIFSQNQLLTLAAARNLVGKRIAVTSPEYHANTPSVRTFLIKGFESEWDRAAREELKGYTNKQKYWESYMSALKIDELKNTVLIITEHSDAVYWNSVGLRCQLNDPFAPEPTFYGSDADRYAYYVEVDE